MLSFSCLNPLWEGSAFHHSKVSSEHILTFTIKIFLSSLPCFRILLLLVIPGHLLFSITISLLEAGHTVPTLLFVITYLAAALLQVGLVSKHL